MERITSKKSMRRIRIASSCCWSLGLFNYLRSNCGCIIGVGLCRPTKWQFIWHRNTPRLTRAPHRQITERKARLTT